MDCPRENSPWPRFLSLLKFGLVATFIAFLCGCMPPIYNRNPTQGRYYVSTANDTKVVLAEWERFWGIDNASPPRPLGVLLANADPGVTGAAEPPSVSIDISVAAIGADLTPNSAENDPEWTVSVTPFWLDAYVVDPHAPSTQLVIQYNAEADTTGMASSAAEAGIAAFRGYVTAYPTSVPFGLTVDGQRRIDILAPLPLAVETHQEGQLSPVELKVSPGVWNFGYDSGDWPQQRFFTLRNQGSEELTIRDIKFSGPDASLFSLADDPALPQVLGPGVLKYIRVKCTMPPDQELHAAFMEIIHDKGSQALDLQAIKYW